jgi:replicative DNA helicase
LFSLEDPGDIASAAMVCDEADVSSLDLDTGVATTSDLEKAERAWQSIGEIPLYMVSEKCTMPQIVSAASLFKTRYNIQAIYLDHIQYISPVQLPHMTRNDTISVYSGELAALSKRLDVAVICSSQLNRSPERDNRPPRLSDLRDSGSLEQDARAVGLLYWSNDDDCFIFEIAKNNYGKSGTKIKLVRQGGKRFVTQNAIPPSFQDNPL